MKILLIIGGKSTENEISRMSALNIRKNISSKHSISTVGISKDGGWYKLFNDNYTSDEWLEGSEKIDNVFKYIKDFDVVFPILHGKYGEDGTIQGLFEIIGIPYVGMGVLSSSIALDKVATKMLLKGFNINMVPYIYVKKRFDNTFTIYDDNMNEYKDLFEIVKDKLNYPVFVKASNLGSSVGCYKVHNKEELKEKIELASKYDNKILIEKAINAREIECAILGNDDCIVTSPGEIISAEEYYSYDSKYNNTESKTIVPANISENEEKTIKNMALKIYKILDGKGLSRCDFFLDKDTNEIYFNEINTMPGFTDISMYPMLIKHAGISASDLIEKLINLALEK